MMLITKEQLMQKAQAIIEIETDGIQLCQEDFENLITCKGDTKLYYDYIEANNEDIAKERLIETISQIQNINRCCSCIVKFSIHPKYNMTSLANIMEILHTAVLEEASVIFGTHCKDSFSKDFLGIHLFFAIESESQLFQ